MKIDFFLVGPPKCGTTTAYHWLKTNPSIFVPIVKEPHFFQFKNKSLAYSGLGDKKRLDRMVVQEEDAYLGLYESKNEEQLCGDCSTMYFYSEDAIREIKLHNPQAKIIIVLRNPIERAFSHYMHQVRDGYEKKSDPLSSFLLSTARIQKGYMPFWDYISPGKYSQWLPKWKASFDHVLVLDYKQLMGNSKETMSEIARFLGVTDDFQTSSDQVFNQSGHPKFPWLNRILKRKTWGHQLLAKVMPQEQRVLIKNKILNKNNRKARLRDYPAFSGRLNKIYESDIILYENLPKQSE
jgi:hypothetical protein